MRTLPTLVVGASVLTGLSGSGLVRAAPSLRVQVDQHGDFLLIGNTLGYECDGEVPAPVVGTIASNACSQGNNTSDSSPDLFWRADQPAAGQAVADSSLVPGDARTSAMLQVPTGGTITHAYLYWAGKTTTGTTGAQVTVDRPGTGAFQQTVAAVHSYQASSGNAYESVANVTALVKQHGAGVYRVSGISVGPFANVSDETLFGAWAMIVFYERAADPLRNLALFDGMDVVSTGQNQSVTLSGFLVPNAGYDGKLGVITYEGDAQIVGDQLFFNNGTALTNDQNPADNFFNATRSWLGTPVSIAGDLPQLTGTPRSMSGVDLDVVDITSRLSPGQTSAPVMAVSSQDQYYLGAFVTSIATFRPDLTTSTKTAADVNGGALLPGDELEYTLRVTNSGNDAAVHTVLSDPLPTSVSYVPGSIRITSGPNTGPKSDAAADDQAEYVAAQRTVVVRLGDGASPSEGGSLGMGESTVVSFRVTVNPGVTGDISNQAIVQAGGQLGAPLSDTMTDGNGSTAGAPPTVTVVDRCGSNADCSETTPVCDTGVSPKVCVQCLVDGDCGGAASGKICNTATHTCGDGCRGSGGNGCPTGNVCTSATAAVGTCVQCLSDSDCGGASSGRVCRIADNTCIDGCRGASGNGCPSGLCTSSDSTIGTCIACLVDGHCGGITSGRICDANHACIDGCRGADGNGCPYPNVCTSSGSTAGQCVRCLRDDHCGDATSGRICDSGTHACIDGCRGTGGNRCPQPQLCTSNDAGAGRCIECLQDSECGGVDSGRVCDVAVYACTAGCRGTGGNGCPQGGACTSTNASIGSCPSIGAPDAGTDGSSDGGQNADSSSDGGADATDTNGGMDGAYAEGGDPTSGDGAAGALGSGGAGPTSSTGTAGSGAAGPAGTGGAPGSYPGVAGSAGAAASPWNDVVAQGNGLSCSTTPPSSSGSLTARWLVGSAFAVCLALRRRKRAA